MGVSPNQVWGYCRQESLGKDPGLILKANTQ